LNDEIEIEDWNIEPPDEGGFYSTAASKAQTPGRCRVCGATLEGSTRRRTCSNACRQKYYRDGLRWGPQKRPADRYEERHQAHEIAVRLGLPRPNWSNAAEVCEALERIGAAAEQAAAARAAQFPEIAAALAGDALQLGGIYITAAGLLRRVYSAEPGAVHALRSEAGAIIPEDDEPEPLLLSSLPGDVPPDHEAWSEESFDARESTDEIEGWTW